MKIKHLILGAGISGLSYASSLDSDDYLIIEKNNEAGGYCRTTRRNGYVWDYSGHFFHFSHPELKEKFMDILESDDVVVRHKNTKIYYNNTYVDYPFQKNIHQLPKEEMIDCLYDLFSKKDSKQYDSFLEMLYGKFGESITEKFLKPYNEKLYACDLNQLDVDAMGRFFPYANKEEIIRNMKESDNSSYNNDFIYPKKGAMVFVEKMLEHINKTSIHFNEEILEIDIDTKTVSTNKNDYTYDYLISTIPLNSFASILKEKIIDESLLSYNQVLVLNLGFDKHAVDKDIHWIYVPSKEINFYRAGFYNNIIGTDRLSMYIEMGYTKDDIISDDHINKQLDSTLVNLKKIGIIEDHELVDYEAVVMNPAYVHITKTSIEMVNSATKTLQENNVFLAGRYSNWKYCSVEDCMLDAIKISKKINCQ